MSRYTPKTTWGRGYPAGSPQTEWKTYTCGKCGSTKRLFVQCVPCLNRFYIATGMGDFKAAEFYEFEHLHLGEVQHGEELVIPATQ